MQTNSMQAHWVSLRSLAVSRLAAGVLVAFWFMAASTGILAQSGRKLPDFGDKKTSPPAASPEPAQTPAPSSRPEKVPIVVTSHLADIIKSSSILMREVSDALIDRLNESSLFSVTREQEMNRKEASDRAKAMSDGYVVWFELEAEVDRPASIGPEYNSQLYVSFVIYKPGTGKILTQGHVYQRPVGTVGGGPLPTPTGGTQIEYRLQRAGRETGERVLQALGKPVIPGH